MLNEPQLRDAIAWLTDCFPDDEDEIYESSNAVIEHNIERFYEGGIGQFLIDGRYDDE